jgi:hypothetical protein
VGTRGQTGRFLRDKRPKTNAAWASHPGRIVIADVLIAAFRLGRKIIAQLHSQERYASMPLSLRSGSDSAFPSSLEEGFLRRPQSPGAGTLDMCRISPDDFTLEKTIGNA